MDKSCFHSFTILVLRLAAIWSTLPPPSKAPPPLWPPTTARGNHGATPREILLATQNHPNSSTTGFQTISKSLTNNGQTTNHISHGAVEDTTGNKVPSFEKSSKFSLYKTPSQKSKEKKHSLQRPVEVSDSLSTVTDNEEETQLRDTVGDVTDVSSYSDDNKDVISHEMTLKVSLKTPFHNGRDHSRQKRSGDANNPIVVRVTDQSDVTLSDIIEDSEYYDGENPITNNITGYEVIYEIPALNGSFATIYNSTKNSTEVFISTTRRRNSGYMTVAVLSTVLSLLLLSTCRMSLQMFAKYVGKDKPSEE